MGLSDVFNDAELLKEIRAKAASGKLGSDTTKVTPQQIDGMHSNLEAGILKIGEPEAIVLRFGRPSLLVQAKTFTAPESEVINARLSQSRSQIEVAIPSVGRINVRNDPDYEWYGTGWLVA